MLRELLRRLADQERALANARDASTELCRQRVEREELELYLDGLVVPGQRRPTPAEMRDGRQSG
jgi:hypothetical protein